LQAVGGRLQGLGEFAGCGGVCRGSGSFQMVEVFSGG